MMYNVISMHEWGDILQPKPGYSFFAEKEDPDYFFCLGPQRNRPKEIQVLAWGQKTKRCVRNENFIKVSNIEEMKKRDMEAVADDDKEKTGDGVD